MFSALEEIMIYLRNQNLNIISKQCKTALNYVATNPRAVGNESKENHYRLGKSWKESILVGSQFLLIIFLPVVNWERVSLFIKPA